MLTRNTLMDISKHSNATIKLADYMVKSKNPLFYNEIQKIDANSDEIDLIEAFHKDLGKTVTTLDNVHQLLSTVDEKGEVLHLKGEKQLQEIFGENYDIVNQTVKLPYGDLELKKGFDKDYEKERIIKHSLGLNLEQYQTLFKQRKNTFKHNQNELHTEEDKIEFLTTYTLRETFNKPLQKIRKMVNENIEFRKNLSIEDKNLLDEEITFTKSMVDGVAKGSLFITKKDGLIQWGTGFKRDYSDKVQELMKVLEENPYVEAVELTSGSSIDAYLNLMNQIKEMNFDLQAPVFLKCRRLEVYNAAGLYYQGQRIIALDIKNPSAAIHEFIHSVDDNKNSKERQDFARFARSRIDYEYLSTLSKKKQNYYLSTREVIARAGEVAYLFEKFDYQPSNESYEEFKNRVVKGQEITNIYDLNLVNNIESYEKRANVYFDIKNMGASDVHIFREYYKEYYRPELAQKLEKTTSVNIPEREPHKVVSRSKNFQKTALSGILIENVENIFDHNEKLKIIDPAKLVDIIFGDTMNISRTTKNISNDLIRKQHEVIDKICDWADKNDNKYVKSRIIESTFKHYTENGSEAIILHEYLSKEKDKSVQVDFKSKIEEYKTRTLPLYKDFLKNFVRKDAVEKESGSMWYSKDMNDFLLENNNKLTEIYNDTLKKGIGTVFKLRNENKYLEELTDDITRTTREDLKSQGLNNYGKSKRFKSVLKLLEKELRNSNEFLNYFSKEDKAPSRMSLLLEKNYQSLLHTTNQWFTRHKPEEDELSLGHYKHEDIFKGKFLPLLKQTGELDKLYEMDSRLTYKTPMLYDIQKFEFKNKITPNEISLGVIERAEAYLEHASYSSNVSIDDTVFNGKIAEGLSLEEIKVDIPNLENYETIQNEIKELKDSFKYKNIHANVDREIKESVEISVIKELEDSLEGETLENFNSLEGFNKTEEQKLNTSELENFINKKIGIKEEIKEDLENKEDLKNEDSPIDPNPKQEEPVKKKRGRKKTIDPRQQSLF
tara:strand:+ start:18855 stop:21866 length:3012 start_codon:yes stop_codon:yes gene_type:complete